MKNPEMLEDISNYSDRIKQVGMQYVDIYKYIITNISLFLHHHYIIL